MSDRERLRAHVVGQRRTRTLFVLAVISLLVLFLSGFVLGIVNITLVGLIGGTVGAAIVAGVLKAGLVPTVGILWLCGFWWFVFPPLVGYLTGNWEMDSRYSYPRFLGYGYTAASEELTGGVHQGVTFGLACSVIFGTVGYSAGSGLVWLSERLTSD